MSFHDVCILNGVTKGSTEVRSVGILAKVAAEVVTTEFNGVILIITVKMCTLCIIAFKQRLNDFHQTALCDVPGQKFHVSNALLATLTLRRLPNSK